MVLERKVNAERELVPIKNVVDKATSQIKKISTAGFITKRIMVRK